MKNPVFVIKKDLEKNLIIVWTEADLWLYSNNLIIKNINFLGKTDFSFPLIAKAKIRYRQKDENCIVEKVDNNTYKVIFEKNQRAIASGQICAIYLDDELIMSWVID